MINKLKLETEDKDNAMIIDKLVGCYTTCEQKQKKKHLINKTNINYICFAYEALISKQKSAFRMFWVIEYNPMLQN